MQTRENNGAARHSGRIILTVFFLSLVFSNALLTLLGVKFMEDFHENRKLAPPPNFKSGKFSIPTFINELESYINDQFSFRKPLLISLNFLKYSFFRVSSDSTAMPAKEGWIFYGSRALLRDYSRKDILLPAYVHRIEKSLLERNAWLKSKGIDFIFVLAPNKHNIYPRFMPDFCLKGNGKSNGERLVQRLAKTLPDVVVNVFPPLRAAANDRQVYYKIDTHWNYAGAKVAVETLYQRIKKKFPHIKVRPFPETEETRAVLSPGNFGRVMGIPLREVESVPLPIGGWSGKSITSRNFKNTLPRRAHGFQRINKQAPPTRVLVFGDSYMARFEKYISEIFGHSTFVNLWDTDYRNPANRFPTDFIETVKPHLVIFLFTERRLRYNHKIKRGYHYNAVNPGEVRKAAAGKES